jgi:hypothetical protein
VTSRLASGELHFSVSFLEFSGIVIIIIIIIINFQHCVASINIYIVISLVNTNLPCPAVGHFYVHVFIKLLLC